MLDTKIERYYIYQMVCLWVLLGVVMFLFADRAAQSITNTKNEYQILQSEVGKLNTELSKLTEEQIELNDYINILSEENVALQLELEESQEEYARLFIASETLQKEINITPHNNYSVIDMTDEERDLLAAILALEAHDQPDVGQRAVVEVIFNRVVNGWAKSVKDVIYQKGQFSTVKYLNKPYAVPDEREYLNIDYVIEHGSTVLPMNYVYFATYKANGKNFIQIQDHYFSTK